MVGPGSLPANGRVAAGRAGCPLRIGQSVAAQFQNANLAASVAEIIEAHGLPPEALMLEVTESVLMNERLVAIDTMNAIANWASACRWTISEPAIQPEPAGASADPRIEDLP